VAEDGGATPKAQNSAIDSAQYREGKAIAGVSVIYAGVKPRIELSNWSFGNSVPFA